MRRRRFTGPERAEVWNRIRGGESVAGIASSLGRHPSTVGVVANAQDGLRRPPGGRIATAALRRRNADARRTPVRRARGTRGGGQGISKPFREAAGPGGRRKR
jgi:hypothetical protein